MAMAVNLVDEGCTGRFIARGLVLEDARHGPQLSLGMVGLSHPPTCSGPNVVGWSWDAVPHTAQSGTRYGQHRLVGRFDGVRFTLTEPAKCTRRSSGRPRSSRPTSMSGTARAWSI